ncbi:hypothetical protein BDV33DRAFT_55143 [Aspergillus novoparasiticus]|uniref:NAD(P)-binding protein n=1 Tax=Aspergillus novoparasiticus TaxID=986946 RepID=A0A5N6F8Q5_9EURO|nr:hypothetical protein BDV33DRAFT_55143 [Aspergillus novoparasiticus]
MKRVWFITGCSRGLGLAIAEAALNAGDSIIATARRPEQLAGLTEKYGGDRVFTLALDVSNNDQVIKVVKAGHERFGRIDIVVNNARYANSVAVEDIDIDDFRAQVDTNLFGVVYVSKVALPILRQPGSGHIFQISSVGGRLGVPGLSAYQSAKWAVGGFSREVAPLGINVTVMEPSGMKTDWAGSPMQPPQVSKPYESTVGYMADMRRKNLGNEPSIPSRVANIILGLSNEEEPPLRLLIGPNAVEHAGKAAEYLAASDAKWRALSVSSA